MQRSGIPGTNDLVTEQWEPLLLVQLQRQHRRVDDLVDVDPGVVVELRAGAGLAPLVHAERHGRGAVDAAQERQSMRGAVLDRDDRGAALVRGDQRGQVTEIGVASRIGEKLATRLPQRPIEPAGAGDVDDVRGNTLLRAAGAPPLPPPAP